MDFSLKVAYFSNLNCSYKVACILNVSGIVAYWWGGLLIKKYIQSDPKQNSIYSWFYHQNTIPFSLALKWELVVYNVKMERLHCTIIDYTIFHSVRVFFVMYFTDWSVRKYQYLWETWNRYHIHLNKRKWSAFSHHSANYTRCVIWQAYLYH